MDFGFWIKKLRPCAAGSAGILPAVAAMSSSSEQSDGGDSLPRLVGAAAAEQKTALVERRYKAKGPQH